jgi:hypothetical protein
MITKNIFKNTFKKGLDSTECVLAANISAPIANDSPRNISSITIIFINVESMAKASLSAYKNIST